MTLPTMTTRDGAIVWWDRGRLPNFTPEIFDPVWLDRQGHLQGAATGRGQVYFFAFDGRSLVLRPYRRGGMIGRLVADAFLRLGAPCSRPYREYRLLERMHDQGLRVPRPVAARYAPSGLVYRAQLITERIPDATPLADRLGTAALPPDLWSEIGASLGKMHGARVDHVDLNCRNILLDAGSQVWLIDFDKCRSRPRGRWMAGNLARLKRSLLKEQGKHPQFFFSDRDWDALMRGYRSEGPAD